MSRRDRIRAEFAHALKFPQRVSCALLTNFSWSTTPLLPRPLSKTWSSLSPSGASEALSTRRTARSIPIRNHRSVTATPGEPSVITAPSDIRITNIALGEQLADESGRTTVKLVYRRPGADEPDSDEEDEDEDEEKEKENDNSELETTVLCSLTPGKVCMFITHYSLQLANSFKIEQATVDVVLTEDDEYLIEVVGKK